MAMDVGDDVIEGSVSFFPPDSVKSEQSGDILSLVAMGEGDDVIEGSVSFFAPDSVESNQSRNVISPEDVAWADSCLVKDSEISDSDWNSLKDVLLEIVASRPDSLDFSAAEREGFREETGIEIHRSSEEAQTSPERTGDDDIPNDEEVEQNGDDDYTAHENIDKLKSRTKFGYPFLPNYSEGPIENENTDSGLDMGFPGFVVEPSSDDIFRVWDLDFPAEEDELIKQLNKALAESSSQSLPSFSDDSLDDLIDGISDLSLNQNSR
ncbi:Vacuolar protein sorting-associated protein like [Actinidia chinensis var. chinensis]|uniref:Vacuolar protein sorting-associated protein like n=1 Tax=Actinidia chinensis var. chinensis TaxID=1590841 RepID=A0A2R6R1J4_ACTCC|nr:Vacuolar protein sorting-associated protein like [Actinidia chinensis var. chinensis]